MASRKLHIPSGSCRKLSELALTPATVSRCWHAGEGIADGPRFLTQQRVLILESHQTLDQEVGLQVYDL